MIRAFLTLWISVGRLGHLQTQYLLQVHLQAQKERESISNFVPRSSFLAIRLDYVPSEATSSPNNPRTMLYLHHSSGELGLNVTPRLQIDRARERL
jgi:hypothetical protein